MTNTEQASEWFTRFRESELSETERKEFAAWLSESPLNIREYLQFAETWGALQSPTAWPTDPKEDLLAAIRNANPSNIVTLERPGATPAQRPNSDQRKRWMLTAAVAASVALAAILAWPTIRTHQNTYRTGLGEQRSIVLSDGSIVQLNTLSSLVIHFDPQHRNIELTQGEAYFRVARDTSRPFEVRTPYARVQALGTEFDVYNHPDSTRVAVIEGKVSVGSTTSDTGVTSGFSASGSNQIESPAKVPTINSDTATVLGAGQQAIVSRTVQPKVSPAKPQNATAWIQRRIVLDNDQVATAVAEFNRYNRLQLQIDDPDLATLRITAVFDADHPDALVKYLREVQGVHAQETGSGVVLSK